VSFQRDVHIAKTVFEFTMWKTHGIVLARRPWICYTEVRRLTVQSHRPYSLSVSVKNCQ